MVEGKTDADLLREAREGASLTQEQAAALLGVTPKTLSRWENGAPVKPRDVAGALRVYGDQKNFQRELDKKVPRGTGILSESSPEYRTERSELTPRLASIAEDFKREARQMGATEQEIDQIHTALYFESQFIYQGEDGQPLPHAVREDELRHQITGLRRWLARRIEGREIAKRRGV